MAHTFDVSAYSPLSTAAPRTISFTAGSGATLVVLCVFTGGTAARAGGSPTFGGIPFTRVHEFAANRSYESIPEMWYHLNPSTGAAYTISCPNTGTARNISLHVSSYKAQEGHWTVFDTSANAQATTGLNPSIQITPSSKGNVIVALLGDGRSARPSAQTLTYLSSAYRTSWSDSTQYTITTTTNAVTAGWTVSSDDNRMIIASFAQDSEDAEWGGILKYYNGASWVECPSSRFKAYLDGEWKILGPNKFKIYRNDASVAEAGWYPVRFNG